MKRLLSLSIALFLLTTLVRADVSVTTDSELRAALQADTARIQLDANIDLSNSTLSIKANSYVVINMNGYTLDRKLTKRGEGGGQVITVRSGAT